MVWITTEFFETIEQARVKVGGAAYQNSFTCIPLAVPIFAKRSVPLAAGTPLDIAIPPGPLLSRLEAAMNNREVLPFLEVRPVGGSAAVLRLDRIRVVRVSPMAISTTQTRQVTLVEDV